MLLVAEKGRHVGPSILVTTYVAADYYVSQPDEADVTLLPINQH